MAPTDSMFLFEIVVEELTSFINCKEFCIRSHFADVFNIHLKDPNETQSCLSNWPRKVKRKTKIRNDKGSTTKVQTGQSILFASNAGTLISNMKEYPMELSLWSKVVLDYKIGSTHIPWSAPFYEYLNKLHRKQEPQPVVVKGDYNVFDEFTSKRMAVIKLNVKLSYLKDKVTTQSISQVNQQTLMYTGFNYRPDNALSRMKDRPLNLNEEMGTIKTIYRCDSGKKRKVKTLNHNKNIKNKKDEVKYIEEPNDKERVTELNGVEECNKNNGTRLNSGIVSLVRSDMILNPGKELAIIKPKSCSTISQRNYNIFNYIFEGKPVGPFGNQVYCVGYFTVENEFADSPKTAESEKAVSEKTKSSKSDEAQGNVEEIDKEGEKEKEKNKFKICKNDCPNADLQSVCSLDLPIDASHSTTIKKCDNVDCDYSQMRKVPDSPDDAFLIDLSSGKRDCCGFSEKVEEVIAGIQAKMKFGKEPCYCECECKFGFIKKTTFCNVCGGYEDFGEEYARQPEYDLPFPCPIFHKLADKNKLRLSTSGSDTKKDKKEVTEPKKEKKEVSEPKKEKKEASESKKDANGSKKEKKEGPRQKLNVGEKISETEKDTTNKRKQNKKDERFIFHYGYTAPQIGHSLCGFACDATVGGVPKKMGWLWNAENIPGLKFRPSWKPGATHKQIVRLLKNAKNPGQAITKKKKKKVSGKVKKQLKRPLLTVQKKDGEYTVTMETMKTFSKPRALNQHPYEDKPLVTYTIGRTSAENLQRRKRKERTQRRLERLQREFIQCAFKNMCQDICLKTYQQALGILPNAERPECACYPAEQKDRESDELDYSCSCSEDKDLTESDTDSDEWIVEFTPPTATFDPTFKGKKVVTTDNSSQYTYMDYRVKLLDRYGNPVPRYFKGPDGKQICSDLGGFWGPDNKWLEINIDGYVGPDKRWAPNHFLGPNGEQVDGESGKFQAMDGTWLVVGVDGYVEQGKWKAYKPKGSEQKKKATWKKVSGNKKDEKTGSKPSDATWSCLGSVSPKQLSKMGIVGHGHDKKLLLSTLQDMLAQGKDVKIPEPKLVPRSNKPEGKRRTCRSNTFVDRRKCKHASPSDKGIVAVDGRGNKIYFRLKDFNNKRPKQRIATLTDQGISLSSFHVPCFHSFISCEMMKKQQYDRLVALAKAAGKGKGGGGEESPPQEEETTESKQPDYVFVV